MKSIKINNILILSFIIISMMLLQAQASPGEYWDEALPEDKGISSDKVNKLFDISFEDDATQSVVLIKDGKVINEGSPNELIKNSMTLSLDKCSNASFITFSLSINSSI